MSKVTKKSQEYFTIIYRKNAAVTDFADLARGEQLDVASASIEVIAERDAVSQMHNLAVGFPYANVNRVTAVKNSPCSGYMD